MMTIVRPALVASFCLITLHPAMAAGDAATPQQAPASDVSRQGGTLSDKLNATGGVIHPEGGVDPAMAKPAPAVGTMPVIPPAGSPGNAPDVQPK